MSTTLTDNPGATRGFAPRTQGYLRDPYAVLKELRRDGPVYVDPDTGLWFLLGYEEAQTGLAKIVKGAAEDIRHSTFPGNPFTADGPAHAIARRIIAPAFRNSAVQNLRGRAQQIIDDALAGKRDGSELRVVAELGFKLPYHITCDLLGIPEVDNSQELREWSWKSLELIDAFPTEDQLAANLAASELLRAHIEQVEVWKRGNLGDDIFSLIIKAGDEGKILRPDQVVPYVHTVYLAGMHTTVNQTALSLYTLLGHPDQWNLLKSRPELLGNAVEEILRFDPTAHYMRRCGDSDFTVGSVTVPAGQEVVCWIASANRDEQRWGADADTFDITRQDARQHIAFGAGPHVCIGNWLAKMELQLVISTIMERFPNSRLADQEIIWTNNAVRGPEELIVTLAS